MTIAGVVVLYRPDTKVIDNIRSYIDQLDTLFVIDNSEHRYESVVHQIMSLKKVIYVENGKNVGIATALNQGAKLALAKNKYNWLLTMDQDSKATSDMLEKLLKFIEMHPEEQVGIVAPVHTLNNKNGNDPEGYQQVLSTMTSGNLLNLSAYVAIGDFEDKLFIDYVDHEYCLRLHQQGYSVIQIDNARLLHKLGNYRQISIAGHKRGYTNHNYLRRYYITRNRLYVMKKYSNCVSFVNREKQEFWSELGKIMLFEDHKIQKLHSILRGFRDYKRGVFGEYPY